MNTPPRRVPGPVQDAGVFLLLLGFALLLCAPVLAGRVPIASDTFALWAPWSQLPHAPAHNTALTDSAHQYLAWEVFARNSLASRQWPLWDPYSFSGFPFAANSQYHLYYPVTWLLWLLPLPLAIQLQAIFNLVLSGTGMYLFCRVLGVSRVGSLVAGLAFEGSGMLQTAIDAPFIACVFGWLPWLLLAATQAIRLKSIRWTAFGVLLAGLQATAGNLQWVVYSYFAVACWIVLLSLIEWWPLRAAGLRPLAASLGKGLAILVGGVLLASVHLTPFFELLQLSDRTGARVSSNSDPLSYTLRLLMPNFFGTPTVLSNYSLGSSNLWSLGIAPLLLAALGTIVWAIHMRSPYSRTLPYAAVPFWLALALLSICVAYGVGPFLYGRWLPGLNATLPIRIGYLFIASVAVLAGIGYDAFLDEVHERPRRALTMLSALLLVTAAVLSVAALMWVNGASYANSPAALANLQREELLRAAVLLALTALAMFLLILPNRLSAARPFALIAVLVLDLATLVPGFSTYVPPDALVPHTPAVDWLASQPGQWRVMGVDNPVPSFVPNSHLLFGLSSPGGYESYHPGRYDQFWGTVDPTLRPGAARGLYANVFVRPQAYTSTLASLLNVRYVAAAGILTTPVGFRPVYTGEITLYENEHVLSRAFLVEHARSLPAADLLARLGSPDFDPRAELLLEGERAGATEVITPSTAPGEVSITDYKLNSVDLAARLDRPAWLVLADNNYPGWHVTVDDKEQQLTTADYILRAVHLEAGEHRVRFWYQPTLFLPSVILSLVTLVLTTAALAWGDRKRDDNGTLPDPQRFPTEN